MPYRICQPLCICRLTAERSKDMSLIHLFSWYLTLYLSESLIESCVGIMPHICDIDPFLVQDWCKLTFYLSFTLWNVIIYDIALSLNVRQSHNDNSNNVRIFIWFCKTKKWLGVYKHHFTLDKITISHLRIHQLTSNSLDASTVPALKNEYVNNLIYGRPMFSGVNWYKNKHTKSVSQAYSV